MSGALLRSCHPLPTVAVTAMSAGLAALAGNTFARTILVTAAVFTGQLSIGWSNDRIDADRDRAVHRPDKPVAAGAVSSTAVGQVAVMALVSTIALSAALHWWAGAAALVIVVCGWLYNLGLKATIWSWLPYAVAFGTLPAVATLARPGHPGPAAWAVTAGALLGVGAHLANVLPDLIEDAQTGVRGLPHRLGARRTALAGPLILATASAVILFGSGAGHPALRAVAFILTTMLAVLSAAAALRAPATRTYFLATVAIAALDIAFFAATGGRLS
jgi:4-hydroxybenzoate polyprenyltransferase